MNRFLFISLLSYVLLNTSLTFADEGSYSEDGIELTLTPEQIENVKKWSASILSSISRLELNLELLNLGEQNAKYEEFFSKTVKENQDQPDTLVRFTLNRGKKFAKLLKDEKKDIANRALLINSLYKIHLAYAKELLMVASTRNQAEAHRYAVFGFNYVDLILEFSNEIINDSVRYEMIRMALSFFTVDIQLSPEEAPSYSSFASLTLDLLTTKADPQTLNYSELNRFYIEQFQKINIQNKESVLAVAPELFKRFELQEQKKANRERYYRGARKKTLGRYIYFGDYSNFELIFHLLVDEEIHPDRIQTSHSYPRHLCWTVMEGDLKISKLLIDHGADVHSPCSKDNESLLSLAKRKKVSDEIINMLIRAGAK